MANLILNPTSTAQWHALVNDAQKKRNCHLTEDVESYLVFLLMRFIKRSDVASSVLSINYLESMQAFGKVKHDKLQDVGDQCLLYSGLFPNRAARKCVNVNYFVELGVSAYHELAVIAGHLFHALYEQLSESFITMMEILHTIREFNGEPCMNTVLAMIYG